VPTEYVYLGKCTCVCRHCDYVSTSRNLRSCSLLDCLDCADWSDNVSPFWPAVTKSAFAWDGLT
nr:hypothetical protein [Tanacetum cinerariifolium]